MIDGCEKISPGSSPISVMSPSSIHSSPPTSSASITNSPPNSALPKNFSFPVLKPASMKQSSFGHQDFPATGATPSGPAAFPASMCFPIHNFYGNSHNSCHLSSLFNNPSFTRQMLFGNALPQSFQSAFTSFALANSSFRSPPISNPSPNPIASNYNPNAKHHFPFNSSHTATTASHVHHSQAAAFNSLAGDCPSSPTTFKRRMLSIPQDNDIDHSASSSDAPLQGTSLSSSHSWCRRSPSAPFSCPLCSVSLEGIDVNSHFYEEVHKVETLRKLNDWAYNSSGKECVGPDNNEHGQFESRSSFDKKMPYSRWETFQRVKQNRHSRLAALVRQTKRKFDVEDLRSGSLMRHDRIWNISMNSRSESSSQKQDEDSDNDSSSEKNVDVVSDPGNNEMHEKDSECEEPLSRDNCSPDRRRRRSTDSDANASENRNDRETGTLTDGKEKIKTLENGLASESETIVNSDCENVKETIDILKKRIRELENKENDSNNNEPTCFICSKSLTKPMVSVVCWHVHCEPCWSQVVSSKRICPQCDSVVTSRDLRRISL